MGSPPSRQITKLLVLWRQGEHEALDQLIPLVYRELHRMAERYMRRERPNHTLQASALIHEAYLRLVDQREAPWQSRGQFFALAARLMRRILVDHARSKGYAKRGAHAKQVTLDEGVATSGQRAPDVLALDDALKGLETVDPRKSQIVEMRFFGLGYNYFSARKVLMNRELFQGRMNLQKQVPVGTRETGGVVASESRQAKL
jgi:RNA polymerase sigma factor (TIGR02999 family)